MNNQIPKRITSTIINALKGGVVPRIGLEYITVGRTNEIKALLHDIDIIASGGATSRFIVGKYGSGKSFLLQTIRNYATSKGFVVMDADLSPERRLTGGNQQGLATYKELIKNLSVKAKPDGQALSLVLDRWLSSLLTEVALEIPRDSQAFNLAVEQKILMVTTHLETMVNGYEFAKALIGYYQAYRNDDLELKGAILKWFKGEYINRTEAKKAIGINFIINDDNWYDFIKLFATFTVKASYQGVIIIIDELVNLYKISNQLTRQNNYEKLLTIYNDTLQGKASHIGFIFGSTPQAIEDRIKGIFSYEALRSRLTGGQYATKQLIDLSAPLIYLTPLTQDEMFVLIQKLLNIHQLLYNYQSNLTTNDLVTFLQLAYSRIGATTNITPREIIRDFIELINILYQNPQLTIKQLINDNQFTFSSSDDLESEFIDIDI